MDEAPMPEGDAEEQLIERLTARHLPFLKSQLLAVRSGNVALLFACGTHDDISIIVSAPEELDVPRFAVGARDVQAALEAYSTCIAGLEVDHLQSRALENLIFRAGRARYSPQPGLGCEVGVIERYNYRNRRLAYIQIVIYYVDYDAVGTQ